MGVCIQRCHMVIGYLIACIKYWSSRQREREALAERLDFTEAPIAFIRDPHKFDSLVRISHERYWRFCEVQTLRNSLSLCLCRQSQASNQVSNCCSMQAGATSGTHSGDVFPGGAPACVLLQHQQRFSFPDHADATSDSCLHRVRLCLCLQTACAFLLLQGNPCRASWTSSHCKHHRCPALALCILCSSCLDCVALDPVALDSVALDAVALDSAALWLTSKNLLPRRLPVMSCWMKRSTAISWMTSLKR